MVVGRTQYLCHVRLVQSTVIAQLMA
jgi:hypothetical protein